MKPHMYLSNDPNSSVICIVNTCGNIKPSAFVVQCVSIRGDMINKLCIISALQMPSARLLFYLV
ncbi:hypothetical protein Hanom_Chr08g00744301 [Helianthus anomalus]